MKKKPQRQRSKKDNFVQYIFCLGITCLAFVFFAFAVSTVGFILKITISPYHFVVAFLLTALACVFLSWYYYGQRKKVDVKIVLSLLAIFAILLVLSLTIAHDFYDVSYDGQWYHAGAIYQLVNGYNPLYGQAPDSYSGSTFINDYPKTLEIFSAVVYAFTHHIQDGKLINVFLMVTAFLLIFPAIVLSFPKIDVKYALVIAALCAINPVTVYQSLSYYVDGASASMLAALVFLLILAFRKMDVVLYSVITFVIILTINFKFFNLVYVGLIVVGFIAICYFYKAATKLHYLLIASLVIGLLFGFNPYITNFMSHGTPFYPIEGISTEMITGDTPQNLVGMNSLEQFMYSIFSVSSFEKSDARLKIPLTLDDRESVAFTQEDARVGGFGFWFSAIFIVTIIIAVALAYMNIINKNMTGIFILLMCLLVLITVLVNPACWWARYVPQFWLIPFLLLTCSFQQFKGKLAILNYALVFLVIVNALFIAYNYYSYQSTVTGLINEQLDGIKIFSQQKPVKLYIGMFPTAEERLKEYGINYVLTDNASEANGYNLNGYYRVSRFFVQ